MFAILVYAPSAGRAARFALATIVVAITVSCGQRNSGRVR